MLIQNQTLPERLITASQNTREVNADKPLVCVVDVNADKGQLPDGDAEKQVGKVNRSLEATILSTNPDRQSSIKPVSSISVIKKALVQGKGSNLSPQDNKPVFSMQIDRGFT